jgi:hypothetical protein
MEARTVNRAGNYLQLQASFDAAHEVHNALLVNALRLPLFLRGMALVRAYNGDSDAQTRLSRDRPGSHTTFQLLAEAIVKRAQSAPLEPAQTE